jgi:hypothetical protein
MGITHEATSSDTTAVATATTVRVTINLPEELAVDLRRYAEGNGKTFTQALKEAISLKLFVERVLSEGAKLLVEHPDKTIREIVFQ